MSGFVCPKGHQSSEGDFCSECGAKIVGTVVMPAAVAQTGACPDCGAARAADGAIFCEVCGYNFDTQAHGEIPVAVPPAPANASAAPVKWEITVMVDPSLRETGSPEPARGVGPFTIALDKPVNLIGRSSDSRAIFPEIPLDFDEAVSHRHALLQMKNGALTLRDIGAANGTRLNGKDLQPMDDVPLHDGDNITMGHWTRITVKAVG